MKYGYARVSSYSQQKDGFSLESQESALRDRGCEIVLKETFTGTTVDRPVFSRLIRQLKEGDTLMVTKLDRFARTATDGAKLMKSLVDEGVVVEILNMGRADNTPMGKLMIQIMFAFAEFERDMIVERFAEGKAVARSNGKRTEGRLPLNVPDFQKFLEKQKEGKITVAEAIKELDISRSSWYNLAKEGV